MKKSIFLFLCMMLLLALCSCSHKTENLPDQKQTQSQTETEKKTVPTEKATSEYYSDKEINSAIKTIRNEIEQSCPGNNVQDIQYAGDSAIDDYQIVPKENHVEEAIAFHVTQNHKKKIWVVGRKEGGEWRCVNYTQGKEMQ